MVPFSRMLLDSTFRQVSSLNSKRKKVLKIHIMKLHKSTTPAGNAWSTIYNQITEK
jgi:hypothetical protein